MATKALIQSENGILYEYVVWEYQIPMAYNSITMCGCVSRVPHIFSTYAGIWEKQ